MEMARANPYSPPSVEFLGAVQTVTGSMHLLEAAGRKILLDCGLYLGSRAENRLRNRQFPFDPQALDAVLLTHAHIDHCGNLPNLVRQGYRKPIYCTPATRDLLAVMLMDSAKIQEKEAGSGFTPLYSPLEVKATLGQCAGVPYEQTFALDEHIRFSFTDAGHVLGSALVNVQIACANRDYAITYTGDLGRRGMPFLHAPAAIPPCDLLISESTYGGKHHPPREVMVETMRGVIERTIAQEGKVLIPAFSLGRTQIVVHYLQKWIHEGLVPRVPIFVDSPLVEDIMEVYRRHPECLPEESRSILDEDSDPDTTCIHYLHSWEESRELVSRREPCIIVASGGMLDGGRAVYHLQQLIDDPRCSIVLVSYQAPGSLGRRLLQRGPTVSFLGRTWNKWANVVEIRGFSGHADHDDFLAAFSPLVGQIGRIQLVHGEPESALALAEALRQLGFDEVNIPQRDQIVWLD